MKRLFRYTLPLLTIFLFFPSCINSSSDDALTWEKKFDYNRSRDVELTASGHYLVAEPDHLTKLDSKGNELWRVSISDQLSEVTDFSIGAMIDPTGEGYAIAGFASTGSDTSPDKMMFIRIGESGTVEERSVIAEGEFQDELSLITADSGFQIAAVKGLPEGPKSICSYAIDDSGGQPEEKIFEVSGSAELLTGPILALTDNSGILAGFRLNSTGSDGSTVWRVIKLDAEMNEEWSTEFGDPVFNQLDSVLEAPDGSFLFAGAYRGIYGWVVKINTGGKLVWEKTYGDGNPGKSFFFDIINDPVGGFILAGNTNRNSSGSTDAWIAKINDTGELIWDVNHGGEFNDFAWSVAATNGSGYVLAGQYGISFNDPMKLWILKLDGMGRL